MSPDDEALTCSRMGDLIPLVVAMDGAVEAEWAAAFRAHLQTCEDCAARHGRCVREAFSRGRLHPTAMPPALRARFRALEAKLFPQPSAAEWNLVREGLRALSICIQLLAPPRGGLRLATAEQPLYVPRESTEEVQVSEWRESYPLPESRGSVEVAVRRTGTAARLDLVTRLELTGAEDDLRGRTARVSLRTAAGQPVRSEHIALGQEFLARNLDPGDYTLSLKSALLPEEYEIGIALLSC